MEKLIFHKSIIKEYKNLIPDIVAVGASAGGLEAIKEFFQHTPTNSGFSFVVIQHLSPEYKSMMSELLSAQTDIPVSLAEDDLVPEANHIYLIPPSKNLRLVEGKLRLESQNRTYAKPNLPIDIFLESLSASLGSRAVGVILSGTGSDGTRGARLLKEAGGLIIAQTLNTAKFDGMPKSLIANNLADCVLNIPDMMGAITDYFKHPMVKGDLPITIDSKEHEAPLNKIFQLLKSKFKTDFSVYKKATISRRIQRRVSITRKKNLDEYAQLIEQDYEEQRSLFSELLIGVTSFYRDHIVFDDIYQNHLREYLKNKQSGDLRLWIAGCSTGEEAYTITMILLEICEQEKLTFDLKVFATDIDNEALAKASNGVYPESIASDLPPEFLAKFMLKTGEYFTVNRQVRERVVFARHDVVSDPPFTRIDFISCRNLLIYLESEIQNQILNSFNFSLKSAGLLLLGNSESLGDAQTYFKPLNQKLKIYESLGINQRSVTGVDKLGSTAVPKGVEWQRFHRSNLNGSSDRRSLEDLKILDSALASLSPKFIPFIIIVNQENDVVRIIGDSRKYLRPMTGRPDLDVSKLLIKDINVPVMSGLSNAFRKKKDITYSNVVIRKDGELTKVTLGITPVFIKDDYPSFAAVTITEVVEGSTNTSNEYNEEFEVINRVNDLEQELQFTRENLQATIEELETSNEELQATNEELLASNEELQSTNEELQSVNEELHTVNTEYQSKLLEMNTLSADVDSLLNVLNVGVVYLDSYLNVRRFTKNTSRIFNIIEHDIGRPFEHISNQINDWNIFIAVKDVAMKKIPIEKTVEIKNYGSYKIKIMPNHNNTGQGGMVIVMSPYF